MCKIKDIYTTAKELLELAADGQIDFDDATQQLMDQYPVLTRSQAIGFLEDASQFA